MDCGGNSSQPASQPVSQSQSQLGQTCTWTEWRRRKAAIFIFRILFSSSESHKREIIYYVIRNEKILYLTTFFFLLRISFYFAQLLWVRVKCMLNAREDVYAEWAIFSVWVRSKWFVWVIILFAWKNEYISVFGAGMPAKQLIYSYVYFYVFKWRWRHRRRRRKCPEERWIKNLCNQSTKSPPIMCTCIIARERTTDVYNFGCYRWCRKLPTNLGAYDRAERNETKL